MNEQRSPYEKGRHHAFTHYIT